MLDLEGYNFSRFTPTPNPSKIYLFNQITTGLVYLVFLGHTNPALGYGLYSYQPVDTSFNNQTLTAGKLIISLFSLTILKR